VTRLIAVMERKVAELIANGQPLILFGDCLILDLDLSTQNLPPGSRVRVGGAVLEVTPMPHNGCQKFRARFGQDALRFVVMRELRHNNLRGTYMRVLEGGEFSVSDPVEVISRRTPRGKSKWELCVGGNRARQVRPSRDSERHRFAG
jgi:MOSC domain-containing protein YiiM